MSFSRLAVFLWAAGVIGNAALLVVLLVRGRWRLVPWFTGWIVFHLLLAALLFLMFRVGSRRAYAVVYWIGEFGDLLLQISIIVEIAGHVYRRGGQWVFDSRKRLVRSGIGAVIIAVLLASMMHPVAASRIERLEIRADLIATVIITFLFTAVLMTSERFGLSWRSMILREGYGIAAWALFGFSLDALHAYAPLAAYYRSLDQVGIVAYLVVQAYWIITFWLPEPAPLVPTEEEKRSIESFVRELE